MKKKSRTAWRFGIAVCALALLGALLSKVKSENKIKIQINSWLVRDRVIPLETMQMRSSMIVGFRISPQVEDLSKCTIEGELYIDDVLISRDKIFRLDSLGYNLGFDISLAQNDFSYDKLYGIPDGTYLIVIRLFDQKQQPLAQCNKELNRNQLGRLFLGPNEIYRPPEYLQAAAPDADRENRLQQGAFTGMGNRGYFLFQRSYLERIYSNTQPAASERLERIHTEISRNEYKPITFSVHAQKDLGKVRVSVTPLRAVHGILSNAVSVGAVGQLTEVVEKDPERNLVFYRWAPKIIEPEVVKIAAGQSQRYWLTIRTDDDTEPGEYHGLITVKPEFGRSTELPLRVRVLPLSLTDTDIQYGMMMTYGFYELDNEGWTEPQKKAIKRIGMGIYRDFREHGLTMIYPHSHFYLKRDAEGRPIVHSLMASLEAYKKLNFPGPFCWYLGHLLQTAKPFHPGSIVNYDPQVAKQRLQFLLKEYEAAAKSLGIPKEKLIVQLVDEPDRRDRIAAGKELNRIAQQMGFKTLVTRPWPDVDIVCSGIRTDEATAKKLRQMAEQWWIYPNSALMTENRAFIRYVFGFGAWHWGVHGVVPWTYQMSQGCNGNPFSVLDGPERMLAYPGVNGPITTPTWEAIRDGINDYKYIYRVQKLISAEKEKGNSRASDIERQLRELKQNLRKQSAQNESEFGDWTPESFEKRRRLIVNWALELSSQESRIGDRRSRGRKPHSSRL